jgi:hypothetical protein
MLRQPRRVTPPRNYGRADIALPAQVELNWTLSRANAQYMEAFSVDGTAINYWKKTNEGFFCTCRYGHAKADDSNISNIRVDNPANLDNLPDNIPDSNVIDQPPHFIVRGAWDTVEQKPDPNQTVMGVPVDTYPKGEEGGDRATAISDRTEAPPREQITDEESAFLQAPYDADILSGLEKNQCGICLGTGRTHAWSLLGGKREIFNSHNFLNMIGFYLNKDARPYSFQSPRDPNSYVEWLYTLPTYFTTCLNYAVRNNTKSVRDLKIFYKIDGSNDEFKRINLDFINSRNGIPTKLVLRVSPIVTSLEGTLRFTHIEMIFQFAQFPEIQIGPLSVASNPQTADIMTTNSFVFPPILDKVEREDIFYDDKYNRMWKITDYTDFMTTKRQVLGWTVTARNLQEWEQQSLLKVSRERYYEVSFAGLERFQGRLLSGRDQVF